MCFGDPCAQNFLDWEIFVLIGSLVELYVGLYSYLCFSHLEKLFWKIGSTPPRYLAICRASQAFFLSQSRQLLDTWWIDRECSCLLNSYSTPGGSIELLFLDLIPCCSIVARYLSCRQAFSRHLLRQLPRHLSIPHLSSITKGSISTSSCDPVLISLDLSLDCSLFSLPNSLISLQFHSSKVSSRFFKFSLSW